MIKNSDEMGVSFETDVFYTGEALFEHIRCGAAYDFLILDIELAIGEYYFGGEV